MHHRLLFSPDSIPTYAIDCVSSTPVFACPCGRWNNQRHNLNSTAINKLNTEVWGGLSDEGALDRLREYFQASSSLSFAANGQEFTDSDLRQLHTRAGDYVSVVPSPSCFLSVLCLSVGRAWLRCQESFSNECFVLQTLPNNKYRVEVSFCFGSVAVFFTLSCLFCPCPFHVSHTFVNDEDRKRETYFGPAGREDEQPHVASLCRLHQGAW